MGDAVLLLVLWATGWLLLRAERQRLERERLHRLLEAASDWPTVIGRGMRDMVEAFGRAAAAISAAFPGMVQSMTAAMGRMADQQRGELELRAMVGFGCYCGHVASLGGPHGHVARMHAGAVPDLVLVAAEVVNPVLGLEAVALWREDYRARTIVLLRLNAIAIPWHLVRDAAPDARIDRTRPPTCGIPWVATVDREPAHA